MTRQDQIELIRQKCIEADLDKQWETRLERRTGANGYDDNEIIRLADVLLAMSATGNCDGMAVDRQGRFFNWLTNNAHEPTWNLRKDDLTEQSQECITFLADLLQ